jgi:formylglycine-generating enzyme required for sulfatase activity
MKSRLLRIFAVCVLTFGLLNSFARADIGYQFVTVGNVGNANDAATGGLYGGVGYVYTIGKFDVTLTQYTAFLNAVAQSDPRNLYSPSMATDLNVAGIARSGVSGSYSYSVIGSGNRPVTYVGWFDAARFANWMHNGQPTGLGEVAASTEQGAYTLNGNNSGVVLRNANALFWFPTENEWYKAAYYDPNKGGAGVGGYWQYATRSDTMPGNVVGSTPNQANFFSGVYSVSQDGTYSSSQNYLTDVGAFTNSASAYGTYDQTGNVYQWNDTLVDNLRGFQGGSWATNSSALRAGGPGLTTPTGEGQSNYGFRIASVPEPSVSLTLLTAGGLLLVRRRRKPRREEK